MLGVAVIVPSWTVVVLSWTIITVVSSIRVERVVLVVARVELVSRVTSHLRTDCVT